MIYELFEGFSEGFWADMPKEEIDENYARSGITIVHFAVGGRRIFLDDSVNREEAKYYLDTQKPEQVSPDWSNLYSRQNRVYGYGAIHPYYERKKT